MWRTRLATFLWLLLIFFSGVTAGGFALRLYRPPSVNEDLGNPKEVRRRHIVEMRHRLKLTDAQADQLDRILDETLQRH